MSRTKSSIKRYIPLIIVAAVIVVVCAIATPTLAYFIRFAGELGDEIMPGEAYSLNFKVSSDTKKLENLQVAVKEQGDNSYPVYVRATIVVTWQDESGNVYFSKPTEDDYAIVINNNVWKKQGEYYYCTTPVNPYTTDPNGTSSNGLTPIFINSVTVKRDLKPSEEESYAINVEVIAQTIQAIGKDGSNYAWQDAWGITSIDGN